MNTYALRRTAGLGLIALLVAVMAMPLAASAATHTIQLDKRIVHGDEGQRVGLGTFTTPDALVGQSCTVMATGNNNTSVHVGNNIEVTSANTVVLFGVEDVQNKTTVAQGTLTLNEQISFTLVLGSDPVYSAELDVTLDCQAPPTTTTTTTAPPTTTTTAPPTTTTAPTTTTTAPPTTTTAPPTTTTISATTVTTSPSEPETTSTTTGPVVQGESTTTSVATEETLPFTGVESEHLAIVAFVALAAGSGLVLTTRQSSESREDL